jgi:nanoRNase/pAp phosphatase (c-di-AMP/oligoRNAs hydrolase)
MSTEAAAPPPANGPAQQLRAFLAEQRQRLSPLLILTHDYPDPDALAAAFGLQHLAHSSFGIECRIAYGAEIGRTENKAMVRLLRIPVHKFKSTWLKRYANVALVDTQPAFENNSFPAHRKATLVIDQHPSAVPVNAELALVDPLCGATCVIVAQALLAQGDPIPARVATALAYGILSDTLDLYRAQRSDVVQTYLQVLHYCDMRLLARIQNPVRPRQFFATLGRGIHQATLHRRLLVSHLGPVETPDLVSQVAEFLLAYRGATWCFVTGRHKGRLHVSLRTNRLEAEAGQLLREAFDNPKQAGGHGPIAGGSCRVGRDAPEEAWQAKEQAIQLRLMKRLRISAQVEPKKPFVR